MSGARVLMVDDDPVVLNAFGRVLHREDLDFRTSSSPEEALKMLEAEPFAVVISDQHMPAMEGAMLLEKLRQISPETIRIMITGDVSIQPAVEAINKGEVYRFLRKPWDNDEIRLAVRQAVDQYRLVTENRALHELTQRQNLELKDLNQNLERKVVERTQEVVQLHQRLQVSFRGTVQALASLSDMHSTIVGNHSKRVALLSRAIGERMNLDEKALFELEFAGMLHDIGKVAVPVEILKKSEGSLTVYEKEVLQSHAVRGEALLRTVPDFLQISRLVRFHHERFDGNGFPDKLKDVKIPLGARIIAAVNAFDKVLNSLGAYATTTADKALLQVQARCPAEFDPEVVVVLNKYVKEGEGKWWSWGEIGVGLKDLKTGMVLSRELKTASGTLLLPKDYKILDRDLQRLENFQQTDPIIDEIYVHRS